MGCAILWLSGSAPGLAASPESAVPPASMRSPARAPAPAPLAVVPAGAPAAATASAKSTTAISTNCLDTGDGYLRAHLGGAIEARIDWPNSGTRCQGEPKDRPPGVRLSFQRARPGSTDLLFVFGVTGIREGKAARDVGVNLTVIVQGTNRIYGTLGDSRCTVDSLTQRPLKVRYAYRVEARGFCTQPAHAVRGTDAVLVSTFEFAGLVAYDAQSKDTSAAIGQAAPK